MGAHLYDAVESGIIEQRREPRQPLIKPIRLAGISGELRNISGSGAQIYCAHEFAEPLRNVVNENELDLEIDLDSTVHLTVQVVYAQKTDTGYVMGMRFMRSREPGRRIVRDLVERL